MRFSRKVRKAASKEIGLGKDYWKRPQPYTFHKSSRFVKRGLSDENLPLERFKK